LQHISRQPRNLNARSVIHGTGNISLTDTGDGRNHQPRTVAISFCDAGLGGDSLRPQGRAMDDIRRAEVAGIRESGRCKRRLLCQVASIERWRRQSLDTRSPGRPRPTQPSDWRTLSVKAHTTWECAQNQRNFDVSLQLDEVWTDVRLGSTSGLSSGVAPPRPATASRL
jgi:hypothetical protein